MDGASPQCSTGWHELAVVRARDLRLRAGFSVLIAFGGLLVARGPWPLLWLAATLMAQLASVAVTEPMRRNPRFPVSRRRGFAFAVSLGTSAAVFAASGPFFWFDGGDDGRLLAILVLAGGAVNVALQAGSSARLLWIGCAPFMILLQLLPLISLAAAAGPQRRSLTLIAFGAGLIVAHLAAGGLSNVQSARRMKQAVREARLERQRAEAASAAKSDFLAVMSHELRTPLNGVLGMAQAMGADELAPAQRERVEILRRSGEILLLLLNDLLDISRIETDRLQIERGVVDIGALAAQAEAVFAPLAAAKRLDFHVRLQASAGAARLGDPDRVRQVLHKLIGNAIKFTDEGEVTALISGFGDELIFEVIDTGPGIAPDQLPNVFERFSQSDPSAARRHGGSGVGLAIARGLARLMEGDVTVRSAPGASDKL